MWKDHYKIGIEQIDQQHKQLFSTTEELLAALKDKRWDKARAKRTIDFLKDYIVVHFRTEEMLQEQMDFEDRARHKQMHRELMEKVHQHDLELIRADYSAETAQKLAGTLTAWLVYHVMREDRKMAGAPANNDDARGAK